MRRSIQSCVSSDSEAGMAELLDAGLDPNYAGGWPARLAARRGAPGVLRALVRRGADPHLLGESGATTLQLAVFSGAHWGGGRWAFLLACCDSSQLADGAAVAVVFRNVPALLEILHTGRCDTDAPTALTGKTVESLAKGYNLQYLLNTPADPMERNVTPSSSPRSLGPSRLESPRAPRPPTASLSPSVARFFHQTAALTPLMRSPLTPTRH